MQHRAPRVMHADDLSPGMSFDLGTHLFSREEILAFAGQWDPQSFHVDEDQARAGFFGDIIASGMHTVASFQRLAVASIYSRWAMVAGRALRDVEFIKPVRPDARLSGSVVVRDVQLRHPGRGLVTLDGTFTDEAGTVVMTVVTEVFVARRVPG